MRQGRGSGQPHPPARLAQDDMVLQHPVLQRLQTGGSIGSETRRGAAWAFGARFGGQLLQFAGTVATARVLLPADYGKVAVVLPIIAFAALFSSLGLASAIIHARRLTEQLMSSAFWLNAVTGFLLAGLVCALAVPLSSVFREPLLVPLMSLASLNFALNLSVVHIALLERTMRFKQLAQQDLACSVCSVAVVVATAFANAGPFSLVLGPLTYSVLRTLQNWNAVRWLPRARPDRASLRELWSYSRGLTGYNVLTFWSQNADNLLLARFVSQADLGNYTRAYNTMKLPLMQMTTIMGKVMFPALTRLRDDRERLAAAWLRALALASAVAAPITFGMAVAAPALVEVLFGNRWLGMVPVLQLLGVAALPQILTVTVGPVLRATGATGVLFRLGVATSVMSLAAMLIGLPWGTVGVAAALTVKSYLEVLVSLRPCLRELALRPWAVWRALRGVVLGCLALAAAGLAVRLPLASQVPAWQVLLWQLLACAAAYLVVVTAVDRQLLAAARGLLHGSRR